MSLPLKKTLIVFATICILSASPLYTFAQASPAGNPGSPAGNPGSPGGNPGSPAGNPGDSSSGCDSNTCLVNPLKVGNLSDLLDIVLAAIIQLGTIFLTIMLIYVGFKFVLAQGNEEKIRDARGALLWTVIGGLILLGATAIKLAISATITGLGS